VSKISAFLATSIARMAAPTLVYQPRDTNDAYDLDYEKFATITIKAIEDKKPFLAARMGSAEAIACLGVSWEHTASPLHKVIIAPYLKLTRSALMNNAGVFPRTKKMAQIFSDIYLRALSEVDVLASWIRQEDYLCERLNNPRTVNLEDIVPFVGDDPWSAALEGRKVLVVHPFATSIRRQYARRALLFDNPDVLPAFELTAYPAVQSMGGSKDYTCWTDALNAMEADIASIDFDVAILGCGGYGLPLGAYIKSLGKPAIHLGGVTQCLFGIKGRRWVEEYGWDNLYFNEHWIYPDKNERPQNAASVENACYWGEEKNSQADKKDAPCE